MIKIIKVELNKNEILQGRFDNKDILSVVNSIIPLYDSILNTDNTLKMNTVGSGELFYNARFKLLFTKCCR